MRTVVISIMLTALLTAGLFAQAPSAGRESAPATIAEPNVHLEGCLYVGGGANQSTQGAGYILEDLKVISHRDGSAAMATRYAARAAADTQDRMKALAGKRVGLTGRVVNDADPAELQVTAIREIVGQCARRAAS